MKDFPILSGSKKNIDILKYFMFVFTTTRKRAVPRAFSGWRFPGTTSFSSLTFSEKNNFVPKKKADRKVQSEQ